LLPLYIKLKTLFPIDIIKLIILNISKIKYNNYLIPHYECLCLADAKNYRKFPVFRKGFEGILDIHTGENIKYEMQFFPNCNVCSKKVRCKFLNCKYHVLNSNYCRLHMNCSCGFNIRLESCTIKHV